MEILLQDIRFGARMLRKNPRFGRKTTDPLSMVIAVLVLAGVALLAALIPACRATRVDLRVALRDE